MDMSFSPEDLAFRDEVRSFIADNYPKDLKSRRTRGEMTKEDILRWHRILYKKGWVVPHWPVQYGGTGWTITQRYIWNEENARAETQPLLPFGLSMVGPVIFSSGNEEQKKRFLPGILSGDDWWCQGYSEPGAGSDLASLKTRAVRDGDHYIVNGHKIWTTLAQYADWMFCLVRTDPAAKAQEGISFLLIDMKTPGITVRPIITMDGAHEVNEVFLEDVKVPVENRIGEENKGWTYAKYLLEFERGNPYSAGLYRALNKVRKIAADTKVGDHTLADEPEFQAAAADLNAQIVAMEFTELRIFSALSTGGNV
ncbi:acyl-CoA dehydrogenase family protein, partial [Aerococcus loyolae]